MDPGRGDATHAGRVTALVLALGVLGISSGSILVKLAGAAGVASLSIAAWRLGVASAFYVPLGIRRRRDELRTLSARDRVLCGVSALFLALHFAAWITSLHYTSVASSVVLVAMSPVFVAILTRGVLHEPVGRAMVAGIGLCMAGTVVIGWHDFVHARHALLGDALALAGAAMIACHLVVGRAVRRHTSTLGYVTAIYPVAAAILIVAAIASGDALSGFSAETCFLLLAVGLLPQVIGHTCFNFALEHAGAPIVALVAVGEPIGATLLALLFLDEVPDMPKICGGAVILVGIFVGAGLLRRPRLTITDRETRP